MKEYKFLNRASLFSIEDEINGLAEDGWVVKSFTVVNEGENNDDSYAYVLLETDDDEIMPDIKNELQDVNDKLSDIYTRLSSTENNDNDKILRYLKSIESNLSDINSNTGS